MIATSGALLSQAPARDDVAPTVGAGSIAGTVVSDHMPPVPIRRAIVTVTGADLRPSRSAITDDDGRFSIGGLPPGRFTLTAVRASFITSEFGAKRPGRPGTTIALRDGEAVRGISMRLWRGAVVTGVLRDDSGLPVEGVTVAAVPVRREPSNRTLSNNGAVTDDAGEFRIFGLEPGAYVVMATPPISTRGLVAASERDVDAALERLSRGLGRGTTSTPAAAPTAAADSPAFDYAPIFFPGTAVLSQAAIINLAAGHEEAGLNFALQRVATAAVEGLLTRVDGRPASGARVQLTAVTPTGAFPSLTPFTENAITAPDGTFRMPAVPPGDYRVVARTAVDPATRTVPAGLASPDPPASLWAATELAIGSGGVHRIALVAQPGITVSGRIRVDVRDGMAAPPLPQLFIGLWPTSIGTLKPNTPITQLTALGQTKLRPDGTFEIGNVPPDTYDLQIVGPEIANGRWWIESARHGDRDLLDHDVVVRPDTNLAGITITLSDRPAELTGSLQTPTGAPAADVFVVAFSTDRQLWRHRARRIQGVRPGVDGRFVVRLPAGEYFVAAITDADPEDLAEPGFLEALVPASLRLTIAAGERKTQDLKISR
jgi:hypothetical protein